MTRYLLTFILLLVSTVFQVQARDWFPDLNIFGSSEDEGVVVWQAGQQYIKIVPKESKAEGKNDHPKTISVDKLRDVLGAIKLQEAGGIFSDETKESPFFASSDISTLASGLSRAFERAKPDEDIIFVVIGRHKGLLAKERKVIGGRAFIQDGKLNLIFGDVYRPEGGSIDQKKRNMAAGCGGCDDNDVRTNPYVVGSRNKEHTVKFVFADFDGLERPRSDWLVLDVDRMASIVEKERNKLPPALAREQARARKEAAELNLERRRLREEMARMRKEMKEMSGGNNSKNAGTKSVEERLSTLDQLKKKGLVSEKEYQRKRQEILNDL